MEGGDPGSPVRRLCRQGATVRSQLSRAGPCGRSGRPLAPNPDVVAKEGVRGPSLASGPRPGSAWALSRPSPSISRGSCGGGGEALVSRRRPHRSRGRRRPRSAAAENGGGRRLPALSFRTLENATNAAPWRRSGQRPLHEDGGRLGTAGRRRPAGLGTVGRRRPRHSRPGTEQGRSAQDKRQTARVPSRAAQLSTR